MGTCTTKERCDHDLFLAIAQDSAGTYDLVKDNNGQFPCAGALCPAPCYEPIEW